MLAELDGIPAGPERWRFAWGCAGAVASRPAVLYRLGYPLLVLAVLAAAVYGTSGVAYQPMHWGLVGLVAILVLVSWLGRAFLAVQPSFVPRSLRAGGYVLVGALAGSTVSSLAHKDGTDLTGLPILTVLFALYLAGFLALTATADSRTLLSGAACGAGVALAWTVMAAALAPIPGDPLPAVIFAVGAMAVAAHRVGGGRSGLLAAGFAGTVAALLIFGAVVILAAVGPAWLIPELTPHALPADRVSESRIELVDPYVWMLLFAGLTSLTSVLGRRTHRAPDRTSERAMR